MSQPPIDEGRPPTIEDFIPRFNALADEAGQAGLTVVVMLDHLNEVSRQSSRFITHRGNVVTVAGLLHIGLRDFKL